jgi:hypothetical protein
MALTTFTSYAEVRAILGVSDEEIEDETLGLPMYEDMLRMELDSVNVGIYGKFVEVSAIDTLTDTQTTFMRYFRLFCAYAVAKSLTSALPMFGPKSIGDGKANMARFSDSPYKVTVAKVDAEFGRMSNLLQATYDTLASTSSSAFSRPWLSAVGLVVDPVTGA